ncbi:hypothetical protein BRADI_3g15575v3 [Brachypodium distachyon]|uniref:Uncharacterized protein n=1 Tax=Brachypodium distachyon TaxID=15368 RepID=A0A2K2CXD3_BRADI|nr:hypothetical protein BRADI_3g15575v3 [Brachypodium distachyon]
MSWFPITINRYWGLTNCEEKQLLIIFSCNFSQRKIICIYQNKLLCSTSIQWLMIRVHCPSSEEGEPSLCVIDC